MPAARNGTVPPAVYEKDVAGSRAAYPLSGVLKLREAFGHPVRASPVTHSVEEVPVVSRGRPSVRRTTVRGGTGGAFRAARRTGR